jgi:hypothetical protein
MRGQVHACLWQLSYLQSLLGCMHAIELQGQRPHECLVWQQDRTALLICMVNVHAQMSGMGGRRAGGRTTLQPAWQLSWARGFLPWLKATA